MNALTMNCLAGIAAVASVSASAACGDVPFSAIRLRKPQTDSASVWQATLAQFAKHRAGVDEVWFSTGISFPRMEEHRANAARLASASAELRRIGILPSLQIQATIGHGDALARYEDNSGITWQTYVAEDGTAAKALNCFRAPGFVAYMREMASVYAAAMSPYSVWIDDDIRIISHHRANGYSGWGCHCAHCLEVFAAKEGKSRTREQLVAEMKSDAALAARWRAFAFEGEADLVRAIGEAVHEASPETRMCQQQPGACFPEHRALYKACHEATGLPVGMRPGAGSYYDHDARSQIEKAYALALQMDTIGHLPFIDRICPEIESCPRSFACRTGRGVLLEALECLAQGMNSISALVIDSGFETPEWYGDAILAPLARNAAMMKRYVAANGGAVRAGYGMLAREPGDIPPTQLLTASLPLKPLLPGVRSELARIVHGAAAKAILAEGDDAVRKVLDEDLLLDGEAADAFCRAGHGAEIGLAGCRPLDGSLRERLVGDRFCAGLAARETPVTRAAYFLDPAVGAEQVGVYSSTDDPAPSFGVSAIAYEAPNGRRRVVFGHAVFTSSMTVVSGDRIRQLHRLADWASHGRSPVVMDTPTRSFVQPRVRKDGSLASVVFVNTTIDKTVPVRLRLRGVAADATTATWSAFDERDVQVPLVREGADAIAVIPPVSAWNAGYLAFNR